jgi:hypothetical protein
MLLSFPGFLCILPSLLGLTGLFGIIEGHMLALIPPVTLVLCTLVTITILAPSRLMLLLLVDAILSVVPRLCLLELLLVVATVPVATVLVATMLGTTGLSGMTIVVIPAASIMLKGQGVSAHVIICLPFSISGAR